MQTSSHSATTEMESRSAEHLLSASDSLRRRLQLDMNERKNELYIKPFYRDKKNCKKTRRVFPSRLPIEVSSPLTQYCETCDYASVEQRRQRTIQPEQFDALLEMRRQLDELREHSKGGTRKESSGPQAAQVDQNFPSTIPGDQEHHPKDYNDVDNPDDSFNESIMSSNETVEECAQSFDVSRNLDQVASTNTSITEQDHGEEAAIQLLEKTSLLDPSGDNLLPKFDFGFDTETKTTTKTESPEPSLPNEVTPPDPPPVAAWNVTHTERCNYLLFGPPGKHRASSPSPHRIFPPTIRQEHVKHLINQLKHEPYIPMAPYTEYSQRIRPRTLEGQEYLPIVVVEAFMMKWMSKASYRFFEREDTERRKGCKVRRDEGFNMNLYVAVMRNAINTWTQNYEYEEPASDDEEGLSDDEDLEVEEDMDGYIHDDLFAEKEGEGEVVIEDDNDEDWEDEEDNGDQDQV